MRVGLLGWGRGETLFPRTAGVMHRGGAGTTGTALRAEVPQQVAHMADQPNFGRRRHEFGVAPAPLRCAASPPTDSRRPSRG